MLLIFLTSGELALIERMLKYFKPIFLSYTSCSFNRLTPVVWCWFKLLCCFPDVSAFEWSSRLFRAYVHCPTLCRQSCSKVKAHRSESDGSDDSLSIRTTCLFLAQTTSLKYGVTVYGIYVWSIYLVVYLPLANMLVN